MNTSLLLIDDDVNLNRVTQFQLEENGYKVTVALNGAEGLEKYTKKNVDIIITDLQMPKLGGMELIKEIRKINKHVVIVVITAHGSVESALKSCKLGADEYITKPFGIEELIFIIEKAVRFKEVLSQNRYLKSEIKEKYDYENIVTNDPGMLEILQLINKVSKSDSTILLLGESGTGKELMARAVHDKSPRKENNFVAVNCAAIPEMLIESELFGHVRGAFTGAHKDRVGKFELANKGTIFLDEIADLNADVQAKLLRVLQEREIEKVGESGVIKVDVRIITATNRNLEKLISENKFREDLYYRINVIPVTIPPLRDRSSDIPLLVEHFKDQYAPKADLTFGSEVIKAMQNYDWPGNVRELQNIIERISVLKHEGEVTLKDLPFSATEEITDVFPVEFPEEGTSLEEIEKKAMTLALEKSKGNQTLAAKLLKIHRHVFVYRMKKFGMSN